MIFKNAELHNVEEIIKSEEHGGYLLSRIPERVRMRINDNAKKRALCGCGCEIRFNIKGDKVKITLKRLPGEKASSTGIAEIYYGSFQAPYTLTPQYIGNEPVTFTIGKPENIELLERLTKEYHLPFDPNLVRVILPYDWDSCLINIEGECEPPNPRQVPKLRYLAYGSLISHGGSAMRPSGTYTMRIAQLLKADLINMSFAGSAQMDEAIADYIAERDDWDFATLELGVNVIKRWTVEEFKKKVDYFISKIAENNKDKWIFCTDLYTNHADYEGDKKIKEYREVVKSKVEELKLPKLVYYSGREMLTDVTGLSADLLHPSATGMEEISRNLAKFIAGYLGK